MSTGPNLVGLETLDTGSKGALCVYAALPLGSGAAITSPNVYMGGKPLTYFIPNVPNTNPPGVPIGPVEAIAVAALGGCPLNTPVPIPRIPISKVNTTVHVNNLLPLVRGDYNQLEGTTDRPFTGPFQTTGNVYVATQTI